MKKLLFVYNRHAGREKNWLDFLDIVNIFTEEGYLVTAYPTQSAGDATTAVKNWASDYDHVVVAGGDGTLNEAIAGLIHCEPMPTLGYIPVGTTNDFSKNLALPQETRDIARLAVTGKAKPCDIGSFNGRTFLYVAAFGAFADVSFTTPQRVKNALGYHAYILESMKKLGSIKPNHIKVCYEGGEFEKDVIYGMISNTKSVGGLANFPPTTASLDDGLLEVTLISRPKDVMMLEHFCRNFFMGVKDFESPMLTTFSCSSVSVFCEEALLWSLDGENGGVHKEIKVEALPHAFAIVQGDE